MIILTNSIGQLLEGMYNNAPGSAPICIKMFRKADAHNIYDPCGVLYMEKWMDDDAILREWDDIINDEHPDFSGDPCRASEFLAGCKVWGVDLNGSCEGEHTVDIYIYCEGL